MKTTDVTIQCDCQIIERRDSLYIHFSRLDKSMIRCGQIIIEYSLCDIKGQVLSCQRQLMLDDIAMDVIMINHCGYYTIRIDNIYCFDILHCLHFRRKSQQHTFVYVFPTLIPIHFDLQESAGLAQESVEYSPYQKGEDYSEPFEIRAYHENDSLRHIHWKASMKKDELFVKVGSQPIIKKMIIAIELEQSAKDDHTLDTFYSLCSLFSKRQIDFEILCPQVHTDTLLPELITNDEHLRECVKRLLKSTPYDCQQIFNQMHNYLNLYVVTSRGIEVYTK